MSNPNIVNQSLVAETGRVAVNALHALGGVALIGLSIKMDINKTDLAGVPLIVGCFIASHGIVEGAIHAANAVRLSLRRQGASGQAI